MQLWREIQMTNLDAAAGRRDTQVARHADGFAARRIDDGEEKRVSRVALLLQPCPIVRQGLKRAVGQVGPVRSMRIERIRGEKLLRMLGNIERLQSAEAAMHELAGRKGRFLPIDDDFAEWLMDEGIQTISLNPDTVIDTWLKLAAHKKA